MLHPLLADPPTTLAPWTAVHDLAPGPVTLMLLLTDGSVLATTNEACFRLTPDSKGSYVNGKWTTLQSMHDARTYFPSQVLKDGRVFVAGGEYAAGDKIAEVFDPQANNGTGTWTLVPVPDGLFTRFHDANSKMLPDGKVIIAPVFPAGETVIFDPATNTLSAGPPLQGNQDEASWVKLPDSTILTIDTNSTNTERYFHAPTNAWNPDMSSGVNLYAAQTAEIGAAILLPNGKAFFLGGAGHTGLYTPSGSDTPGSWTAGPDIPNLSDGNGSGPGGAPDAPAAMMVNGKVLCAFSRAPYPAGPYPTRVFFYEYDYADHSSGTNGKFTPVNAPTGPYIDGDSTSDTAMLDLPDGTVLFVERNSQQLFAYQPSGAPQPAWKPTISSISVNTDGSYHLTGTQLNGISEGAAYGDDMQMSSNYPIVRLTDTASPPNVFYCRTHDWSSTGVMTGATPVTTEFDVPTSVNGAFSLVVVANGISSNPITFPSPIWVDFNYTGGIQAGSYSFPYKTFAQGVTAVPAGGTIKIKTAGAHAETMTISKAMTIVAVGGHATIGSSTNH